MNRDIVRDVRYKLQKRVRRVKRVDIHRIKKPLLHLWDFLCRNSLTRGIIEELDAKIRNEDLVTIHNNSERIIYLFDEEINNVSYTYSFIKNIGTKEVNGDFLRFGKSSGGGNIKYFIDVYLEIFYDYIDEKLDSQSFILSVLKHYKHKCEWFQKEFLYNLKEDRKSIIKEKNLALHLYEFLYDQGLEFSIEPNSLIGEPDLVAAQNTVDPLIADAKVFDGNNRNKAYLIKGFNQIYQYILHYNESFGYLIVYKACEEDLNFALPLQSQTTPYITHNNKTIFIITIDIYPHKKPASKRGVLKTYTISEEELITALEDDSENQLEV